MISYRYALEKDSLEIARMIININLDEYSRYVDKDIDIEEWVNKKYKFINNRLNNNYKYYLACDNNKIVGCIYYYINNKEMCFIQDLYVLSEYQNKGIGTYLFNYVKNNGNIKKIVLNAICDSKAVDYYLKLGGRIITEEKIPFNNKLIDSYVIGFEVRK